MKKHDNMWVVQCIHMVYKEIDEKGWHNNSSKKSESSKDKTKIFKATYHNVYH